MVDLTTEYLGLKLKNPLVPSSSPLTGNADTVRQLEDQGAAALVLPSLFQEHMNKECDAGLDAYLEQIRDYKSSLDIPVIASLNGVSREGWLDNARLLQEAGADALELNVYYVATDLDETAADVENRYVDLLRDLKQHVSIPVAMKLSSQFSALGNFVRRLEQEGANGVVLFNRFYQPDIGLFTREVVPMMTLSSSYESLLRVHWVGRLYGKVGLDLSVTGGIHDAQGALKAIMAGASTTQLCSVLLKEGPEALSVMLRHMQNWLEEQEYADLAQLRGSLSREASGDAGASDRANYVDVIESHKGAAGLWR